jgi:hypothetical protein
MDNYAHFYHLYMYKSLQFDRNPIFLLLFFDKSLGLNLVYENIYGSLWHMRLMVIEYLLVYIYVHTVSSWWLLAGWPKVSVWL